MKQLLRRLPWAGLLAALLALLVVASSAWQQVEEAVYDRLLAATAPASSALPIVIVGIDEESFSSLGRSWPWPRSFHARVLENLRQAGVATVAFDIVFAEPSGLEEDAAFAAAIRNSAPVVLAADVGYAEAEGVRKWLRVEPLSLLRESGAETGFASIELERDGVQRRIPSAADAFWRQVIQAFARTNPGVAASFSPAEGERIRYVGGPHTFPYISYHRLLDPDEKLSANWREALREHIVLIGRDLKATTEVGAAQADMFQTPFFHRDRELMPGVEIQANLVASLINGESIRPAWGRKASLAFAAGFAALVLLATRRWRLFSALASVTLLCTLLVGVEILLFAVFSIWLPVAGAILTGLAAFLAQAGTAYLAEQRQRLELKRAFSMYVAPAVVEEIAAHPELLRLGGDRRELTLMFTDLAGFTEMAESRDVAQVAALLNRHLSEMTTIILAHGGTVDKFIGDAIMAFWGAPLPDPQGALNAVRAAIAMQARMEALRSREDGVALTMRIGLHRGECIVGNLGGDNRFDYTAIGDAVNLASRLEGANKVFGTDILISSSVAEAVAGFMPMRQLDTLCLKGKRQAVDVFTPCTDARLVELTGAALAFYRAGRWQDALAAWREVAVLYPEDPVAATFLGRLATMAVAGWPTVWDGITVLDSK